MLQSRQFEDLYSFQELSVTPAVSPGAITDTSVQHSTQACTLQGTTNVAQFALGDTLQVIAPASAALNGVEVKAYPTATAGTCNLVFRNNTGGTITPTASTVYKIIATRFRGDIV